MSGGVKLRYAYFSWSKTTAAPPWYVILQPSKWYVVKLLLIVLNLCMPFKELGKNLLIQLQWKLDGVGPVDYRPSTD